METGSWEELSPKMSQLSAWRHALLARFFRDSETREEKQKYADWALENKNRILHREHPWQLWLNNMGRVSYTLGDIRNASKYYNDSLALCLSGTLGPTIQVMALLPMSGLWKIGGLPGTDKDEAEKKIRMSAGDLNPDYFKQILDERDFTKILETVWKRPEALFPFTYR